VWSTRRRREYSNMAEHKLTANAAFNIEATSWNAASPPTSVLVAGHLERVYDYLMLNGVFESGSIGMSGTRHVFPLVTSANTSRGLIKANPDLREDFRYAFSGMGEKSPLVSAYGMALSYNGFKHVIDYPRRYDIVAGAYVERLPYDAPVATTKGYKQELNDLYLYAEYEDSVIHIPSVYRELVPRPKGNMGSGFTFSPQNYMGEFGFKVIEDRQCNPLGNKGFFHALFKSASEPGETWHGFVIRHRTCPPDVRPDAYCYETQA